MNYVDLTSKLVKNTEEENTTVKNEEAVKNSIMNILSTRPGSVPGHPEFGCNLGKFLFELINPLSVHLIDEEIRYSLQRWEKRINVKEIKVNDDPDYNRITIRIIFTIKQDVDNNDLEYIYTLTK
jgi:phage baseplate assembly protein W